MFVYRAYRAIFSRLKGRFDYILCILKFIGNHTKFSSFRTSGVPYIYVSPKGNLKIGKNFAMNNGINGNPIGCYEKCTFFVAPDCELEIGDNVGISQTALISYASIKIGDNVKIGGGTCVWTTDFHSLDHKIRRSKSDTQNRNCKPVTIEEDAFIGAKCIILKGVTIGARSIIGAGSVVTKSIPSDCIAVGNPAKIIKRILTSYFFIFMNIIHILHELKFSGAEVMYVAAAEQLTKLGGVIYMS